MRTILHIKILMLVLALLILNSCASKNENLCTEGKLLYQQENFEGAIEKFDAYLAANPNFQKSWLNWNPTIERVLTAKGNAYFHINQFEQAITSYDKSIAFGGPNANNEVNYFNRGLAQFYMNNKKEARASFDFVDDQKFNNPTILLLKVDIFTATAEFDTAMILANKCLELDEKNGDALIRKVNLWIQKDKPDSASSLFQHILGMKENNTFSLFTKNITILDSYYALSAVEHDSVSFYKTAAVEQIDLNEYSKASASLSKALNFSQNPASIFLKLGDVNMALGKIDKAIEFYNKALAQDMLNIDASWKKANALLVKGEKDTAKAIYEQVLSTDPENIFAYVALKLNFL